MDIIELPWKKDAVFGLIRHVLTFAGGYFASEGFISADEVQAGAAAVVTLAGVIWSAVSKKHAAKVEIEDVEK